MKNKTFQNATGSVSIPMTNDYLFKALLQKNSRVLKSLICSLLHFSPAQVKSVSVTNPIIPGEHITEKMIMLDVNVTFNNDSRINLEMQVVNEHNWCERSTYYACKNFTDLNQGDGYTSVKSTYQIGFLDFTLFPEHPKFYATYRLCDVRDHHIFTDKLSIGVVDLTNISLATTEDKRYNIDKWARLFKAQTWEDIKMLATEDSVIYDAAETIYQLSEDDRIRQECEAREDYIKRKHDMEKRQRELERSKRDLERQIAQKDCIIGEKDKEIARLKALLAQRGTDNS